MSEQNQGIYQIPHANNGVFDDVENKNTLNAVYEVYNENITPSEELKKTELLNPNFNHDVIDIALHQTNSKNIISFEKFKEEKQLNSEIDDIYSQNIIEKRIFDPSEELLNLSESDKINYYPIKDIGPLILRERERIKSGNIKIPGYLEKDDKKLKSAA